MVLLSGPRQAGKTTISKHLLKPSLTSYYNWDVIADRKAISQNRLEESSKLWIFDEIHKKPQWRNWLKGVYDSEHDNRQILVTGSARLDIMRRAGDSLQGRYFYHRLHPLTLSESLHIENLKLGESTEDIPKLLIEPSKAADQNIDQLLRFGGFPEPFSKGSERFAKRWRSLYADLMIRGDLRDLERILQTEKVELLFDRLPSTIGTPVSLSRFGQDLETTHVSIARWLKSFERLLAIFTIHSFGLPKIRAVKEAKKVYLWDWARCEDAGARLENLVAAHLMRLCDWSADILGEKLELRFFRNAQGHEVDFILLKGRLPWIAIEVKSSEQELDRGLKYFLEHVRCPYAFQLHLKSKRSWKMESINGAKILAIPITRFLAQLP